MRLHKMFVVCVAVVAAAPAADQAAAVTRAATACNPLSKANPGVLRCTVSGFVLDYSGSLKGRGVNTFRWIVNCATGKSYTDGTETFTGSVEGVGSGTYSWAVRSTGTFDCKRGEVTSVSAYENLYSGTGALAGMYGSIHRGPNTYSGVLSS